MKWDIFCSVVDNFGDIGVTWRLARQLVAEHELHVRLWVDDVAAFARICPQASPDASEQVQLGVEVRQWDSQWQPVEPADVVIEAFACELPAAYVRAITEGKRRILWLNLEYLSAEDWVSGCHGLPSLQSGGVQKYFFFPGFTEGTGGLLREAGLLTQRQDFVANEQARQQFLRSIGVEPIAGARLMSLFTYESAGLSSWLDVLEQDSQCTQLLVPEGRILADLGRWLAVDDLKAGDSQRRGALHINILPFIEQRQYDQLLWCCDFNAVRGEDSFLRAQWAGRPLLWHIYQQEEGAHWEKMQAFLSLYCRDLSPLAGAAITSLWQAWSAQESVAEPWQAVLLHWDELSEHAEKWCEQQAEYQDLATTLVQFQQNWL
ncbi:elongation factor P maturation arginine rhamnosyltransferase EarP [Pseudomonas sp. MS19]|uniref:elongation factor P maturation arginine rhamnosyltransferase EarP n=1 Tax=Pseudomonas sp. MS19 TaxID=2579939 RepID=UPI0015624EEE|nr:elongation factor P maturation arginine rhamnosyltransferase EarP [Pseudomonas sp. MS19]